MLCLSASPVENVAMGTTEMIRVLKPGGYFIFSDFVVPRTIAKLGEFVAGRYAGFPNKKELEAILRCAGMEVIQRWVTMLEYTVVGRASQRSGTTGRVDAVKASKPIGLPEALWLCWLHARA